jgi:hypothetical protein
MGRKSTTQSDRRHFCGGLAHLFPAAAVALLTGAAIALGQTPATLASQSEEPHAAPAREIRRIAIVLARELRDLPPPISPLDNRPADDGVAGARLAINDNNTTGRFLGQEFTLTVVQSSNAAELIADARKQVDAGASYIVADASAPTLRAPRELEGVTAILNAGASDDRLRSRVPANVVHTAVALHAGGRTGAILRWALAALVPGVWNRTDDALSRTPGRSATVRLKIVEERQFSDDVGKPRDGGHEQIQEWIPAHPAGLRVHVMVAMKAVGS